MACAAKRGENHSPPSHRFTLYRMALSVKGVFTNDLFEYLIIIVTVGVLALASIVMALGQPEEENRRTEEGGMMNVEGRENGSTK